MAARQGCKNLSRSPRDLESEAWIWHSVTFAVSRWPKQGMKSSPDSGGRKLSPSLGGKTYIPGKVGMVAFFFFLQLTFYTILEIKWVWQQMADLTSNSSLCLKLPPLLTCKPQAG